MCLFWPSVRIGLCIRIYKIRIESKGIFLTFSQNYVASSNRPSSCKLTFKTGYFLSKNIVFFELLLRLFWLHICMGLCESMPRVKNWKQRYSFSIVNKSTRQLTFQVTFTFYINFQKKAMSAKFDHFFSYWCVHFDTLFWWDSKYVCHELNTEN